MRTIQLGKSNLHVPTIAVGCMRISGMDKKDVEKLINTALDLGANFFDHADIYGRGISESVFADSIGMNSTIREKMLLQSKCGIVPGKMFDFSKDHIIGIRGRQFEKIEDGLSGCPAAAPPGCSDGAGGDRGGI